jgi:hypothetical protein
VLLLLRLLLLLLLLLIVIVLLLLLLPWSRPNTLTAASHCSPLQASNSKSLAAT